MQLSCPSCGHRDARVANRNGLGDYVKALVGVYPLRCRRCRKRWETSVWQSGDWRFARCPRCYRQELTTWSEEYYHAPTATRLLLQAGATPYRCAACRCNFASFRACKEKFAWRHKTRIEIGDGRPAVLAGEVASLNNLSSSLLSAGAPQSGAEVAGSVGVEHNSLAGQPRL